jgi:hypothetical protein
MECQAKVFPFHGIPNEKGDETKLDSVFFLVVI